VLDVSQGTEAVELELEQKVRMGEWLTAPSQLERLEFHVRGILVISDELISRLEREGSDSTIPRRRLGRATAQVDWSPRVFPHGGTFGGFGRSSQVVWNVMAAPRDSNPDMLIQRQEGYGSRRFHGWQWLTCKLLSFQALISVSSTEIALAEQPA